MQAMGAIATTTALIAATAAVGAPQYAPVGAELVRERDGLANVFAKLKAGEEVRVGYFGGSITAAPGWRVKTLEWLRNAYPDAKISEIDGAIGGTGSDLGVYRYRQDVLQHKPDLVFVEFSVNDGGASPESIWRGMEGIIRQTWEADPTIDICYIYTFANGYQNDLYQGQCPRAASADEMLADYYGIPSINVALTTVELEREGKLVFTPQKDANGNPLPVPDGVMHFSDDGVHPLDAGHALYTQVIADALTHMADVHAPGPHKLKPPFIEGNWEAAGLAPLKPRMLTAGWHKLSSTEGLGGAFASRMPEMWEATSPGEKITFRFRGTAVKLYDILGPDGAMVTCTVDGVPGQPVPRFDSYCSYPRLATLQIADGLEDTEHEVTVEIRPEQPDRSSVVDVERNKPGFDPAKYDGTAMRVGAIMLIGELVGE